MDEIVPGLYLGSHGSTQKKSILKKHGIKFVLNLAKNCCRNFHPLSFTYLALQLSDNKTQSLREFFDPTFAFIDQSLETGGAVLVHCFAGVSRSSSIVIAYLMKKKGWPAYVAYQLVKQRRSICQPNNGFLTKLMAYEEQLIQEGVILHCPHCPCGKNDTPRSGIQGKGMLHHDDGETALTRAEQKVDKDPSGDDSQPSTSVYASSTATGNHVDDSRHYCSSLLLHAKGSIVNGKTFYRDTYTCVSSAKAAMRKKRAEKRKEKEQSSMREKQLRVRKRRQEARQKAERRKQAHPPRPQTQKARQIKVPTRKKINTTTPSTGISTALLDCASITENVDVKNNPKVQTESVSRVSGKEGKGGGSSAKEKKGKRSMGGKQKNVL